MTGPRPFRFGVLAGPATSLDSLCRDARLAEELGYSSFLLPDHLGPEWGPLVALAVVAQHTERLAVGPLVLAVDLRQPVVLYKELATLAQLAPRRLEIGLGAGWYRDDFTRSGVAMSPPSERIERLDEAVTVLRALWSEGRATRHGRYYDVRDARGEPRPPDPGAVRWTIGGGGRRILEVAARHADIVSVSARLSSGGRDASFGASATAAEFERRTDRIRDLTADRPTAPELQTLAFVTAVVEDGRRYASRVVSPMFGLPPAEALASPLALVGTVDEICERLSAHRDRLGITYWVVNAAAMTSFAGVVERLTAPRGRSAGTEA